MNPSLKLSLIGLVLALSGCNRSMDQTPTTIFMALNNEMCQTRDAKVMLNYVTKASQSIVEHLILPVQQIAKALPFDPLFEQSCVGAKANIHVLREVADQNDAEITYMEGIEIKSIRLLRENGAWKVNVTPPFGSSTGLNGEIAIPSLTTYRSSVQI